jgi:Flp pilus assembly protein TadD
LHLVAGNLQEAIDHERQAAKMTSDCTIEHNSLAVALKKAGELEEAYECMSEAMCLKRGYQHP